MMRKLMNWRFLKSVLNQYKTQIMIDYHIVTLLHIQFEYTGYKSNV